MNALIHRHNGEFLGLILVACPACGGKAQLTERDGAAARRLVCTACGHNRDIEPRNACVSTYPPTDNICNGLSLWLEVETRHGRLYAFNEAHLDHIADYVASNLREMAPTSGLRNASVTSRLPLWIKQAKNRTEVLKLIDKLRSK
ncbi:zinc ribbon domain-containing protein [Asticcacaulis sp. AND118]|uniref:zinc ribbon domain-containing protein n=1 Tax=Asticcacaulis sp. AND118 TaxID=2840468 RepID=UPI001CFFF708|nr:zinc ribbon domain-containing protein [Asticcacaulis sp. AND118]UDF03823.1 zinc ribbon domain-containing protein [Asticcacaulis sp. AND118]